MQTELLLVVQNFSLKKRLLLTKALPETSVIEVRVDQSKLYHDYPNKVSEFFLQFVVYDYFSFIFDTQIEYLAYCNLL